jgi:glycosyltransferase involved in cell wall biosynthesis
MQIRTRSIRAPFVSVVVPTFNRLEALTACVQAIVRQDYPRNRFEVIIVDDGSLMPVTTSGREPQHDVPIRVLRQANAGPASARNLGAQHARGDLLAFTDDDCIPTPHWLRELAQAFHNVPGKLVGGRTVNALVNNLYSTTSQIIVDEAYAYFLSRNSDLRFFASNNMAMSAEHFHENGGFDPSFRTAEDRDFCDRWIRRGYLVEYVPKAIVHHYHQLTLEAFWRQHFNYGRGAYRFHRVRAQHGRSRLRPDLWFYASVCRRGLFTPLSWKSFGMAGLLGVWQAANLAGFLWQGFCQDSPSLRPIRDQGLSHTTGARGAATNREKREE